MVDEAAAAFGLQVDYQDDKPRYDTFYLWPCNQLVWALWWRIQSQWRIGMQGREGLDYQGVTAYLREVARIRPRQLNEVFGALQAMERAAMREWDKQRAEQQVKLGAYRGQ